MYSSTVFKGLDEKLPGLYTSEPQTQIMKPQWPLFKLMNVLKVLHLSFMSLDKIYLQCLTGALENVGHYQIIGFRAGGLGEIRACRTQ